MSIESLECGERVAADAPPVDLRAVCWTLIRVSATMFSTAWTV